MPLFSPVEGRSLRGLPRRGRFQRAERSSSTSTSLLVHDIEVVGLDVGGRPGCRRPDPPDQIPGLLGVPGGRRYPLLNREFFVDVAGTISSRCSSALARVTSPSARSSICRPASTTRQSADGSKKPEEVNDLSHPLFRAALVTSQLRVVGLHRVAHRLLSLPPTSHPSGPLRGPTATAAQR